MQPEPKGEEQFHPRPIGSPSPLGKNVYEFAVFADPEPSSSLGIVELVSSYHGKMIGYLEDAMTKEFAGFYFVDTSKMDCSVSDLTEEIRDLQRVKNVQVQYREGHLLGHFMFPLTVFGNRRVLAIRVEGLVNIEEQLTKLMGSAASSIIYDEGRSYGLEVMRAYREALKEEANNEERLIENVKEGSKATGWGTLEFRLTDDMGVRVALRHPPVTTGGWRESRFLYGIFGGLIEGVYGRRLSVSQAKYDARSDVLSIIFSSSQK